jgi:hypothetical protein
MAKHYQAHSSGLDMITVEGPGLRTESQGLNNGLLQWILTSLDLAYEAGLRQGEANMTAGPKPEAAINPNHYKVGGVECIDYLKAKLSAEEFRGFLKGNAIKYLSRAEQKGHAEDYAKAAWYTTMLSGKDPRAEAAVPHQPSIR